PMARHARQRRTEVRPDLRCRRRERVSCARSSRCRPGAPGLRSNRGRTGRCRTKRSSTIWRDCHCTPRAPLPLLQVALAQLEDRKDGNLLTFAVYRAMGGVAGAIRNHARAALAEWQTEERRPVLDRLLFHLVQRDAQQRVVYRLAPRREIE